MATINHDVLTSTELHEPIGFDTVSADQVYVSDGLGSGGFQIHVPGAEHHARTTVINNASTTSVTAAVDSTLHTNTDYISLSPLYTPSTAPPAKGISIIDGQFTVAVTGVYQAFGWLAVSSDTISTLIGISGALNGVATASLDPVTKFLAKTAGDIATVTGFGIFSLTAGDTLELFVAADKTSLLTIHESNFVMFMLQEGA